MAVEQTALLRVIAGEAGQVVPGAPPFPSAYLADLIAVAAIESDELDEYMDELEDRFRSRGDDGE